MANKNIKGITIEIDGNTSGLDKALKSVNNSSVKLNSELKDVNKLLKFDPSNATGLAQKQELLTKAISNTSDKLNQLKSAQSQVEAQFKSGNIGEEQYRAFQREIATTEQSLKGYKSQLSGLQSEQEKLGQNTKRLNTFFEASGKSIDDFSDILGTRLVNSIKNGTATSDQLEMALNKIGKEALGAGTDLNEMKQSLDKVDDGGSINNVKNNLETLKSTSNETDGELAKLGGGITSGNMMQATETLSQAGEKIKEFAGAAQDAFRDIDEGMDNYTTKTGKSSDAIKVYFDEIATSLPIDDMGELGNAFGEIDTQFDLTGKKLQSTTEYFMKFANINNTDVSDAVKNAKDVIEQFNLKAEDIPMVLDAVTKTAQDTGTSVDDLFNIVKENSSTFEGMGLDVATSVDMIGKLDKQGVNAGAVIKALTKSQTSLASESAKASKEVGALEQKLQDQNKQLEGTKSGTPAYKKLAETIEETKEKLEGAKNSQAQFSKGFGDNLANLQKSIKGAASEQDAINQAAEIFGKKQAPQLVKAIRDGKLNLEDFGKSGTDSLGRVGKTFEKTLDPIDRQQMAMQSVKVTMAEFGATIAEGVKPILDALIPILKSLSETFSNMPDGVKTFAVVLGVLVTAFTLLAPFIAAIVTILPVLGTAFAAIGTVVGAFVGVLSGPVIAIIAVVIGVIIGIIAVIKNWGAIVDWLKGVWDGFVGWLGGLWNGMKEMASNVWNGMKDTISNVCQSIADFVKGIWQGIKDTTSNVWNGIKDFMSGIWQGIKDMVSNAVNGVKNTISNIWDGIKNITSSAWEGIKSMITTPIEAAKNVVSGIIDKIKGLFNFSLKFPSISIPHIPLPHFSLSGSFNPLKGKIPSIGIDWYAKGGILTKPTAFGMNGNNIMVGGEAGKEAVAPLSDLMAYVEKAVANQMGSMSSNFAQMIQLLTIIASKDTSLNMDGKAVTAIVDSYMSNQQQQAEFGIGRM